jgi:cell division septation protein DedD
MQDEGFHEIQLNGKQLVFLFMAATVVAVVIFLCGVMVGRGVPEPASLASIPDQQHFDPTAASQPAPAAVASAGSAPLTVNETLSYHERLEDPEPAAETLRPAAELAIAPAPIVTPPAPRPAVTPQAAAPKPAVTPPQPVASKPAATLQPVAPKPVATPAPVAPTPAPTPAPAAAAVPVRTPAVTPVAALNEPFGSGFVVQVAAVRQRVEADRIAQRLSAKGYPAFVTTAGANFRVRVGKYDDRRQAETIAGRLEREEQFKPWITR